MYLLTIHSKVRHSDSAAHELVRLKFAIPGLSGEFLHVRRQVDDTAGVAVEEDRRDQPGGCRYCYTYVYIGEPGNIWAFSQLSVCKLTSPCVKLTRA